jgi:hypothetical protein
MAERRQAARRDPIEVELQDGRVFIAHPLPWMVANDLGNEIVRQNLEAANDLVRMWISDAGLPELQMQFAKKITDWQTLFKMAYPDEPEEKWNDPKSPGLDESADLILASLDVNHLEHIKHLVDPNFQPPMLPGGASTSTETEGESGKRTESTPDSGSVDSTEPTPSI